MGGSQLGGGAGKTPWPPPRWGKRGRRGNLASAGGLRGGGTARAPLRRACGRAGTQWRSAKAGAGALGLGLGCLLRRGLRKRVLPCSDLAGLKKHKSWREAERPFRSRVSPYLPFRQVYAFRDTCVLPPPPVPES